ncbi:MAG: uroporphyrinogen-III synthase [Myxococcota bacterium]
MNLAGRRVLVTRQGQDELIERLQNAGAIPLELPCLEIGPPADPQALEAAARRALDADLLVFVSERAAERFLRAAASVSAVLTDKPAAAVGAKTAAYLARAGFREVITPQVFRGEALLRALEARLGGRMAGLRVVVPRAPEGRTELIDGLKAAGAAVDAPEAYRLLIPGPASEAERQLAEAAEIVTFLSGRAIDGFLERLGEASGRALLLARRVAVIGPVAADRARALGVRVDVQPSEATVQALVDALAAW